MNLCGRLVGDCPLFEEGNVRVEPWYALVKTIIVCRPVKATAVARAIMLASVPELVNRTYSRPEREKRFTIFLANSFS